MNLYRKQPSIPRYGRYCFCRLPFGIKSASDDFQKAMDHLLEGYPCEVIVDDILIWGTTEAEHYVNRTKVYARALSRKPGQCINL